MTLEGWYSDPYGRHEARWLSEGTATKLVRDATVTSYDEPPGGAWTAEPQPIEPDPAATGGSDLRRADEAEAQGSVYDPSAARWAAIDQVAIQAPSAFDDVKKPWPPGARKGTP